MVSADELKALAKRGINCEQSRTSAGSKEEQKILKLWVAEQVKQHGSINRAELLLMHRQLLDSRTIAADTTLDELVALCNVQLAQREDVNPLVAMPSLPEPELPKAAYQTQAEEYAAKFRELSASQPRELALFNAFVEVYKYIPTDCTLAMLHKAREGGVDVEDVKKMLQSNITESQLTRIMAWAQAHKQAGRRLSNRELIRIAVNVTEALPNSSGLAFLVKKIGRDQLDDYDKTKPLVDLLAEPEQERPAEIDLSSIPADVYARRLSPEAATEQVAEYLGIRGVEANDALDPSYYGNFLTNDWQPGSNADRLGLVLLALYEEQDSRGKLREANNWQDFIDKLHSSL